MSEKAWYELPDPGRNAQCLCGSGRKVKKCCLHFYETTPRQPIMSAGMFISHERLWPGSRVTYEELAQRVGRFPGPWLLRVLGTLQWLLRNDPDPTPYAEQLSFVQEFGNPVLARKVEAWLRTGRAHRVFHRCTLPALMQIRLLQPAQNDGPVTETTMQELVDVAVMANELLERDYETGKIATRQRSSINAALLASVFRNMFYSHKPHWGAATGRNYALLVEGLRAVKAKLPKQYVDVEADYEAATGMSPRDLLAIATAIISHFDQFDRDTFNKEPSRFVFDDTFLEAVS